MAKKKTLRFDKMLVLYQYFLSLFGVEEFSEFTELLGDSQLEELDEDNNTKFFNEIEYRKKYGDKLTIDKLFQYDQNIVSHTSKISEKRGQRIKWKYFQYLSLLFTEIYLDWYFENPEKLLNDLNNYLVTFNNLSDPEKVDKYILKDLSKIAFWNATGSGKTLLMHINILQYLHYANIHHRHNDINKIILLTPNVGLSNQHLKEFELSGLPAELFQEGLLAAGSKIEIIDIHKIKDEKGQKTVSVDAFEGNNLVLVDEGHRGSSGIEWKDKRDKLCSNGFSFEYSATFGQAMKASNNKDLLQEYARCILFDYSYKYFYRDGYGKDYRILNMADDSDEEKRNLYLTASMLTFYQQYKLFEENIHLYQPFLVEKPLMIFVGSKVTAVRKKDKHEISDVVDILIFLSDFVRNKGKSVEMINLLMNGSPQLLDTHKRELFENSFYYLVTKKMGAEDIYTSILKTIFHTSSAGAVIHIENLKGVGGEIALRAGNGEYFGVINVGDDNELIKLCEKNGLSTSSKDFSKSLFSAINENESKINILIGSKKFTEGWNSWRVSNMGLMNVGKSEGSEIIQLFGRGVRLKGLDFCLKRSSEIERLKSRPQNIGLLETLNIFGIRSEYMAQFKEYLETEGMPAENETINITLPVIEMDNLNDKGLKTLRVNPIHKFKREESNFVLGLLPSSYLSTHKVILDWYPRIQEIQSKGFKAGELKYLNEERLTERHIAFLDFEDIFFEAQRYKNEKSFYNLSITKKGLVELFNRTDWYTLFIPKEEMEFERTIKFKGVYRWQEIARILLAKYIDKYYKWRKCEWESQYLEYVEVNESILINEYEITIEENEITIIEKINQLVEVIKTGKFKDLEFKIFEGRFQPFKFERHLYNPLIHIPKGSMNIKVKPVALNEGEQKFVLALKSYFENNTDVFIDKELYLLRNKTGSDGIGFFEADNFYPDFVMWILLKEKQYITFIDPKGLRNIKGIKDKKIEFGIKIKEIEKRLSDKNIILNSFIISATDYEELQLWAEELSKDDYANRNVLFLSDKEICIEQILRKVLM
ncbi:MAG: DEAD/DEAH box helicase family protein [Nitrospirae bacterium]|nr:DEAD/DEAH box helicase family protein [Nitrospirota bacterium]